MGFLDFIPLVGDLVSGITSMVNTNQTNKNNLGLMREQNQFNSDEAEKNRQFQSAESDKAAAFNAEQALLSFNRSADFEREMFEREAHYNSPANQLRLMREAGLNPNLFSPSLSSASGGAASSPAATASAPGGSAASSAGIVPMQSPNLDLNFVTSLAAGEQLRRLKLENRDLENQIIAKEKPISYEVVDFDDNGLPVIDVVGTTPYREQALQSMYGNRKLEDEHLQSYYNLQQIRDNLDILRASKEALSLIPEQQYKSLLQDVKSKMLNNTLLQDEVELQQKYGISSKDSNGLTTLFRVMLRDPDNASRIIDALYLGLDRGVNHVIDKLIGAFEDIPSIVGKRKKSSSVRLRYGSGFR